MKIINPATLELFRTPGHCEWCGRWCQRREACHWQRRGIGGGSRLDIRINLWSGGGVADCGCHHKEHNGKLRPYRRDVPYDLLRIIGQREGMTPEAIRDEINRINRLDKSAPRCQNHGKGKYAGYPMNKEKPRIEGGVWYMYCPECERQQAKQRAVEDNTFPPLKEKS